MSSSFEAVYENGVLHPLEPVTLAEHQRVSVTVPEVSVTPSQPTGEPSPSEVSLGHDEAGESLEPEAKPWRGVFAPAPPREPLFTKEFKVRIADLPPWQPFLTPHRRQEADDNE